MKNFKFKYITFYFIISITFIINLAYSSANKKVLPEDKIYLIWCHKLSNQQICNLNNMENNDECHKNVFMGKRQAHHEPYLEMCRKAYITLKE